MCMCLLYYEIRMGKNENTIKGIINYKMKFAKNHLPQNMNRYMPVDKLRSVCAQIM